MGGYLPLPPVDPVSAVVDIIAGIVQVLFGGIFGGSVNANIAQALNGLRDQMVALGNALMRFAWKIAQAAAAIYEFLKVLWYNWIKRLVEELKGLYDKIKRTLEKILKPVMDAIRRQRQQILDIYNRFIRPLIVIIEKIRRIIHILQLFHIHIFDALDRKLARLEIAVMTPILRALYQINTIGNWVSFMLNQRLLIFRGLFLGTMAANRGGAFDLLASAPAYGFVELPHIADQPVPPFTPLSFAESAAAATSPPADIAPAVSDPAQEQFIACLQAPIGQIDLTAAVNDLVNCLLAL